MDATILCHLVLEKLIYHAMAGRLHLGLEGLGSDDEPEVRLLGRDADHGLVVSVLVRVIEDLQTRGFEGIRQL